MPSPWFLDGPVRKPGHCKLFCFPFAGGGGSLYSGWSSLSPAAEVIPVQLPGRENRLREKPIDDWPDLLAALLQAMGPMLFGPWAVFGHSFGGLLAYEVAKAAINDGHHQPEVLFISACRPPDVTTRFAKTLHALPDEEFVAEVQHLGGMPPVVASDASMRALVLPSIRADIKLCENYEHRSDDVLDAPIVALSGAEDPHADAEEMLRWEEFTHGPFDLQVLEGGHFFLRNQGAALCSLIKERLESTGTGRR